MIKLIASDMDGTLLDGEGNVPPETFDLIKRLRTAGIGFVASSGRRFDTLQELFAPVSDQMDFVASNGAQVVVAGRLVDREVFSHAALRRLKNVTDLFDGLHLVVFDRKISYLLDDEERFERELDKNLPNPTPASSRHRSTWMTPSWIWHTSWSAKWARISCSHRPAANGSTSCSTA